MDDGDELTAQDAALYRAALQAEGGALSEVARVIAETSDEVDKSIARLIDMGLLRVDGRDRLTAVSPMLAEATVLGTEDLELGARRAAVERRRDAIRRLIPEWNAVFAGSTAEPAVEVVTEPGAVANVLMHYAQRCEHELLSLAASRPATGRSEGRVRTANLYSAGRGARTRAIYQHSALRDRATRAYLQELAGAGARVRLAPAVPGRSLVVDRAVALLPIPTDEPAHHGLAVVREPNVVAWVVATFEALWADAAPFEEVVAKHHEDGPELDETRAAILRLMAEGEKDEAISRRLSISVRTCRRHIADYMAEVGASSRFQAGVIAARSGHTDTAPGTVH